MFQLTMPILQTLHEEHMAVLALLERLENFLGKQGAGTAPDVSAPDTAGLLSDLAEKLEGEIGHHYTFEEEHLFPRFQEFADAGIPMMLRGEHDTIRPLATRLAELARGAREGGFAGDDWAEFHRLGLEMVEREVFHVQKEEMGFLPALDQMLPPTINTELEQAYNALKEG